MSLNDSILKAMENRLKAESSIPEDAVLLSYEEGEYDAGYCDTCSYTEYGIWYTVEYPDKDYAPGEPIDRRHRFFEDGFFAELIKELDKYSEETA